MPQDTAHSDSDWGSSGTDESSLDSKKVCGISNDDCLLVELTNKSNTHAIAFRSWLKSPYSSDMLDKIIETGREIVIDWPKNTDVRPASLHPLRKNAIIGKFLEVKRA